MKVSTENDNNFGYEKITILVDNMLLSIRGPRRPPNTRLIFLLPILKILPPIQNSTDNTVKE